MHSTDADDGAGDTPLLVASRLGNVEEVRLLLETSSWRTRPNESNANGETPLHLVMQADTDREEITGVLLKHFAGPNRQTKAGDTPLHYVAACNGSIELVNLLLDQGANPFITNNENATPLDLASRETGGSPAIIPVLREAMQGAANIASAYGVSVTPSRLFAPGDFNCSPGGVPDTLLPHRDSLAEKSTQQSPQQAQFRVIAKEILDLATVEVGAQLSETDRLDRIRAMMEDYLKKTGETPHTHVSL
jgi:hypothetical protein